MTAVALFNPVKLEKGEFRICLNLTNLGEQAWDALDQAKHLGFPKPRFHGYQRGAVAETWAILVQEFHDPTMDFEAVLQPWNDRLDQLTSLLPNLDRDLLISGALAT
jgi:hypothetical protein